MLASYVVYFVLDIAATPLLEKRVHKSLPIFEGILDDGKNILRVKPGYTGVWERPHFSVSVRTNSRGFREDFEFNDADVDVAFMGDSFSFGHGVEVEKRYSNISAGDFPGLTVVSLSYNNGFQPEHYEYFLEKHPELKPDVLFVGLYLGNDLDSDLNETVIERADEGKITSLELPYRDIFMGALKNTSKYRYQWLTDFVESSDVGKIVAIRINKSSKLRRMFKKELSVIPNTDNRLSTELGNLDQHNLRAIRAIKEIDRLVNARRGELHVLLIPQNFLVGDMKSPHIDSDNVHMVDMIREKRGLIKAVMDQCMALDISCHDLSGVLDSGDYFYEGAHWNESGNEKVGRFASGIIANVVERKVR